MNPLRLALGTLTALPVPPPTVVDRVVAGRAMVLAPLAGAVVAAPAVLVLLVGGWLDAPPLLLAALAVALAALASRGLHLDGLADTADGLAASYDRDRALAVMRRGDTGPAGAATLVLTLLIQVAALAAVDDQPWACLIAVVTGRSVLSLACVRGVPSARPQGLGATVAGTVAPASTVAVAALTTLLAGCLLAAGTTPWWAGPVAVALGYAAGGVLLHRCVTRFGGVTGDVLGGCVEAAVTAVLVGLAVA